MPPPTRLALNIKAVDRAAFVRRLHASLLGFAEQLETLTTDLLDSVAPIRTVRCHNPLPTRPLSSEAEVTKRETSKGASMKVNQM